MNSASDTRERLLDAAADILESEGLAHLNTNALAERAGVTPPTVYRNFKNKEEAVECLARRFIQAEKTWLSTVDASFGRARTLDETVTAIIDLYWESARQHRGIVALRSAMRVWPVLRQVEEESLKSATNLLADVLAPHFPGTAHARLARTARHTVETVCATIDRCYGLAADEQAWRIQQLKLTISAYLAARQQDGRA
ncbi:MAG: TetR/AcrR family transcriptional regulator [Pseudohaliea sp.]